jgi:hypothetical protein
MPESLLRVIATHALAAVVDAESHTGCAEMMDPRFAEAVFLLDLALIGLVAGVVIGIPAFGLGFLCYWLIF